MDSSLAGKSLAMAGPARSQQARSTEYRYFTMNPPYSAVSVFQTLCLSKRVLMWVFCVLLSRAKQRECRALRVGGLDDPTSARHLLRTVRDLAAAIADAFDCRVDIADIEVIQPESRRLRRRTVEHGTYSRLADREQLVRAHGSHVHGVALQPTKHRIVKVERFRRIVGVQLMPTDLPRFARDVALTGLRRLEQIEARALGIGHDRETADVRNVGGRSMDLTAPASHL